MSRSARLASLDDASTSNRQGRIAHLRAMDGDVSISFGNWTSALSISYTIPTLPAGLTSDGQHVLSSATSAGFGEYLDDTNWSTTRRTRVEISDCTCNANQPRNLP